MCFARCAVSNLSRAPWVHARARVPHFRKLLFVHLIATHVVSREASLPISPLNPLILVLPNRSVLSTPSQMRSRDATMFLNAAVMQGHAKAIPGC